MSVFDFLYADQAQAVTPEAAVERAPTPLLAFLAGEHAEAIARIWPAPHAAFLALPAARRHGAALALIQRPLAEADDLRRLAETAPLRDLAAFAFRHPPRGLVRALGRLGETLWTQARYRTLIALMGDGEAAQILHHAAAIDAVLLDKLAALPPVLRRQRIVELTPNPAAAQLLGEAFALAMRINPRRQPRELATAWARAESTNRLFIAAVDALSADRFGLPMAAPAMPRPYRAISTRQALQAEALRFRNCIASYDFEIGADIMAVYIREGDAPAMIALKRDVGGWRLAEALAADNLALPDHLLTAVAADFAAAGVRIGPPARAIEDRLEQVANTPAVEAPLAPTMAAMLGLGQLWR